MNFKKLSFDKIGYYFIYFSRLMILNIFLIFILFFINTKTISAHPHVFINAQVQVVFDENGLKGLKINWIYDPNFSYQIISDCDMDFDDSFSEDEIKDVYKYYFEQLEKYNYFIKIKLGSKEIKNIEIQDFKASIDPEDEVVEYNFFIPLNIEYNESGETLEIDFADPTLYTAFTCPQSKIYIKGYKAKIVNAKIDYAGKIYFTFYKG